MESRRAGHPSKSAKTVLVVEDEDTLQKSLRYNLEREGYTVLSAEDGELGLRLARQKRPDLYILDIMLPGLDGLSLTRILRRETQSPILMLTARVDEVDRVAGLETGADDYLTKPFGMRELIARVRALLRRADQGQPRLDKPVLENGGIKLDTRRHLVEKNGREIALKPKEFELLAFLMSHPGEVFSREELLTRVWGYQFGGGSRTVDVHVRWLREKIEDRPSQPDLVQTIRGAGYRFKE
ncbi:MAG TPA: response regulator transcription factor [Dehalococcoidia bacterium]|nr:response regulator transcription factor [Dehalococcoidia bacterium]